MNRQDHEESRTSRSLGPKSSAVISNHLPDLLRRLGIAAGVASGSIGAIPATAAELAEYIRNRKQQRAARRLELAVQHVRERVERLEDDARRRLAKDDRTTDLFEIALERLAEEDDERKVWYHLAFVDFVMDPEHDRDQLWMAGEAIKGLTSIELDVLPLFVANRLRDAQTPKWCEDTLPIRLQSYGLYRVGLVDRIPRGNAVCHVLAAICEAGNTLRDAASDSGSEQ